jgi:hypothetical protein
MSIDDLIIFNTIDSEQIRYDCTDYNYFSKIIYTYNGKSHIPLHKFWVLIDKCKLLKINLENNVHNISIALSLKTECIKKIQMIEKQVNTKLHNDKITNLEINSKINDDGKFVPTFDLFVDTNTIIFDSNEERIVHINNILIGSELTIICELSHLLLNSDSLTSHWKVVQLKKIESFDITKPLFIKLADMSKPQELHIFEKQAMQQQTVNIPVIHKMPANNIVPTTEPKKVSFAPSMIDLSQAISGLKKTVVSDQPPDLVDQSKKQDNKSCFVDEEKPIMMAPRPMLKHVVTKEPLSITEMLKKQQEFEKSLGQQLTSNITLSSNTHKLNTRLMGKDLINDYKRLKRVKRLLNEIKTDREKKYEKTIRILKM